MLVLFIVIPIVLTLWNIISSIQCFMKHKDRAYHKAIELISMFIGSWFLYMYLDLMDIKFANWDVQLYNTQLHSIISPDSFVTIIVISLVGLLGYLVIRFIPIDKQSPIVSAVGIAGVYLGIGICILWCIQTKNDLFLFLFPANCILSRYTADLIYFLMKPLEWIFLIVIYAVDVNPENRIAVQYPHSAVPKI